MISNLISCDIQRLGNGCPLGGRPKFIDFPACGMMYDGFWLDGGQSLENQLTGLLIILLYLVGCVLAVGCRKRRWMHDRFGYRQAWFNFGKHFATSIFIILGNYRKVAACSSPISDIQTCLCCPG